MSKDERKYFSRSENTQRQRQNKKLDRILNYLIAIVIVLICISSYFIFFNEDKEEVQESQDIGQNDPVENDETDHSETDQSETTNTSTGNEQQVEGKDEDTEGTNVTDDSSTAIVTTSNDPLVDEVVVDPNWQPTPTSQTEPHTSVFAEGHIDYEEKLATIYAVTSLSAENSILWNIKNNGSADTAIAVISSNDKELKYRVSIEWVKEQGWKPVKVEKLNTIEGTF